MSICAVHNNQCHDGCPHREGPTIRRFQAGRVTRPDAGGNLWAPVDQFGNESGDVPSYDDAAVSRRCDDLNRLALKTE
jgi:hypothetical protein